MFYFEYTLKYLKNKLKSIKKNGHKCKNMRNLYIKLKIHIINKRIRLDPDVKSYHHQYYI